MACKWRKRVFIHAHLFPHFLSWPPLLDDLLPFSKSGKNRANSPRALQKQMENLRKTERDGESFTVTREKVRKKERERERHRNIVKEKERKKRKRGSECDQA